MRMLILAAFALLAANTAQAAPDYAGILRAGAEGPILTGYRDFATQATQLQQSLDNLCAHPGDDTLAAARTAFNTAADRWEAVQWVSFGPVESFHRGQRVQFWPDKKNAGDRQMLALLKDRKADKLSPHRIAFASVAIQGLPALEMLLFGDGHADKLLAGGEETAFRCQLLAGIGANLAQIGQELETDWSKDDGFITTLKTIGSGVNPYSDERQAASQMFNALYGQLSAIAEVKLAHPLGASVDEARPGRAENWRSQRSLRNILINLDSIRAIFATAWAPALAADGKAAVADRFLTAIDTAQTAVKALPAPMETTMTEAEGWTQLQALKAKIKAAAQLLESDVANALALKVGFNALDGD